MTDLNLGKTVTDGGGLRTFSNPANASDGSGASDYTSYTFLPAYYAVASDHKTAILKTDLGSAQSVGSMLVYSSGANPRIPWTSVEYASSSTGPWTGVSSLSAIYETGAGPLGTTKGTLTFDAATARYWRLVWDYIAGPGYQPQRNINAWEIYAAAPTPPPPPGVTITINEVEFASPKELTIRNELNAAGQMTLVLDRNDVQATAVNLTAGSICRVTFTEIHPDPIAAFILESGDWDLISSDEEGGEELRYTGPGVLWLLHRAVVAFEEYEPTITAGAVYLNRGRWEFGDSITAGRIIHKLVSEALSSSRPQAPLAGVTIDFTASVDSNGDAWTVNIDGRWRTPIGRNLYGEVQRIAVAGDISIEMGPDLVLHAYNSRGTDRTGTDFGTGVVRFAKGANIADELTRSQDGRGFVSHGQVHWGDGGDYGWITKSGSWPYVQEAPYDEDTDNHTTANRAARAKMGWKERAQDAPGFAHKVPWPGAGNDELTGDYLPGPDWTENGLYWLGDTITAHTGTADLDYDEADGIVYAITLMLDQTGFLAPPFVELNAPFGESEAGSSGGNTVTNNVSGSGSSDSGSGSTPVASRLYELASEGGDPLVKDHGATGSTETIDPSDGNVHTLTLDADCTFTINPPTGTAATLELWITQDGTGGWGITWPGSVTLQGTLDTTASTTSRVILDTVDAGTTWIATVVGSGTLPNVEDLPTAETDIDLVLAPDGAGGLVFRAETATGDFLTKTDGEGHTIDTHGSMGSTETFDLSTGNVQSGTLAADCTITLDGWPATGRGIMQVRLTEDGTGGWTPTFSVSGSLLWLGGSAPTHDTTADSRTEYLFWSDDAGTTVYGGMVGISPTVAPTTLIIPGATTPAQTAEGSAVWDSDDDKLTIGTGSARKTMVNEGAVTSSGLTMSTSRLLGRTTASTGAIEEITVGTGLDLSAGALTATATGSGSGQILISDSPSTPLIFADLIQNEAQDDLVYADT